MVTFEHIGYVEFQEAHHELTLNEFSFIQFEDESVDQIFDSFIHSSHYPNDCLTDLVRSNPNDKSSLREAFNISQVSVQDFKKFTKTQVTHFLIESLNLLPQEDDRKVFANLLNAYFNRPVQSSNSSFYIIDRDWFEEGDPKVNDPEGWIYGYYFIVGCINYDEKLLTMSIWSYD